MAYVDVDIFVGRILVIESALAAGVVAATPAGEAGSGVLLMASRCPRPDGTLPARLVRILPGLLDGESPAAAADDPEDCSAFALIDWESPACRDEERIYLLSREELQAAGEWRRACWQACPERWADLLEMGA
mgnify:CR=1 FL=1